jgi:hypothetical protein
LTTIDPTGRLDGRRLALARMGTFNLQQCIVEYTWDGETATGMLERSTAGDHLESA